MPLAIEAEGNGIGGNLLAFEQRQFQPPVGEAADKSRLSVEGDAVGVVMYRFVVAEHEIAAVGGAYRHHPGR